MLWQTRWNCKGSFPMTFKDASINRFVLIGVRALCLSSEDRALVLIRAALLATSGTFCLHSAAVGNDGAVRNCIR